MWDHHFHQCEILFVYVHAYIYMPTWHEKHARIPQCGWVGEMPSRLRRERRGGGVSISHNGSMVERSNACFAK